MLRKDFWITPEGTFEMGQSEHAQFALKRMFNLPEGIHITPSEMWGPSPAHLIKLAKKNGADPATIAYMERDEADPRWYAMKHYGWVRISKAKANLWQLTDATRAMLVNSLFWAETGADDYSSLEFVEFSQDSREFYASKERLSNVAFSTNAIRMGSNDPDVSARAADDKQHSETAAYRAGVKRRSRPGKGRWMYGLGDNPQE